MTWLPAATSPAASTRTREESVVRVAAVALAAVAMVFAVHFGVHSGFGHPRPIFYLGNAAALLIAAWAVSRAGAALTGFVVGLLILLVMGVAQFTQGGFRMSVLPWLAACPLVFTVLAGPRAGLGLTLGALLMQGALFGLDHVGYTFVDLAPEAPTEARSLALLSTLAATALVTVVGAVYEVSRRRALALAAHTTAELKRANRDLREARDRADEANRAKTQFVANISHELRTPMNGVIGMADLLRTSELSEEQQEYTETIHRSARALLGIIDDILDFSKLDFDKLELTTQRFDLEATVNEVLSLLAAEAYGKGVELSATLHRDVPSEVVADPGRLRQVLLNLLSNAIKFTAKGEVNLGCILVKTEDAKALLRFDVRDTGIGIPKHLMPKVFDSFYQTDNSSTRRYGGTGLGLTISKRLVELMGGQMGVDSTPERGSTFYFTLPVVVPEDVLDSHDERSGTFTGLRALCLVSASRPRAQGALAAALEREGVLTDVVSSLTEAQHALEQAAERDLPYRVCIVDALGAGEDALQLATQLQALTLPVRPSILLLIPPGRRDLRAEITALGFPAPVSKPARRVALMAGIAASLSEAGRKRHERAPSPRPRTGEERGRLLLAEDNETNRRTALLMLQKMGYEVDLAEDGARALEMMDVHRYDAVLMDCQMPGVDGYEASARIRARADDARHTTIIALTAHASPADQRRCRDAGMNDYLAKPVRYDDLQGMLDKWVHGTASGPMPSPLSRRPESSRESVDLRLLASLRAMAGEDQHMVNDLILAYLDEAPRIIETMGERLEEDDAAGLAEAVHKLVSSSGNVGANELSELAIRLEAQARARDLSGAPELVRRIEEAFLNAQVILRAQVDRPGEVEA
ncbi:MAG: response regulator [Myxococcales bacterium]|nr:response regulator [Myxococcales bacterium]